MILKKKKPRNFNVGIKKNITIKDMGEINLSSNEQITFITQDKKRYDFCRKDWGFYATPSINHRLKKEGFRTALVKNSQNRLYIMVVDKKFIAKFNKYCKIENQKVLLWLDK
jgi:hypothetical protein